MDIELYAVKEYYNIKESKYFKGGTYVTFDWIFLFNNNRSFLINKKRYILDKEEIKNNFLTLMINKRDYLEYDRFSDLENKWFPFRVKRDCVYNDYKFDKRMMYCFNINDNTFTIHHCLRRDYDLEISIINENKDMNSFFSYFNDSNFVALNHKDYNDEKYVDR